MKLKYLYGHCLMMMMMDFCLPVRTWELCKTEPRLLVGSYLLIRSKTRDRRTAAAEQTIDWGDTSTRPREQLHGNTHIAYPNMKETTAKSRIYSVFIIFKWDISVVLLDVILNCKIYSLTINWVVLDYILCKVVYYNDVNNQRHATTFSFINLFNSDLHVSGDKFAHPQEHFFDCIYSVWCNAPTLLPTGATVEMELSSISTVTPVCTSVGALNQELCTQSKSAPEDQFHLNRGTGRQQWRRIVPKAVYTVKKVLLRMGEFVARNM